MDFQSAFFYFRCSSIRSNIEHRFQTNLRKYLQNLHDSNWGNVAFSLYRLPFFGSAPRFVVFKLCAENEIQTYFLRKKGKHSTLLGTWATNPLDEKVQ